MKSRAFVLYFILFFLIFISLSIFNAISEIDGDSKNFYSAIFWLFLLFFALFQFLKTRNFPEKIFNLSYRIDLLSFLIFPTIFIAQAESSLFLRVSYFFLLAFKSGNLLAMLYQDYISEADGSGKRATISIFLCLLLFLSLLSLPVVFTTSTSGDEPFYLLNAHSLAYDFDFDLKNNIENRDYKPFFDGELKSEEVEESWAVRIGFPFLIVPGYLFGGRLGVILELCLFASLMGILLKKYSYILTASKRASFASFICGIFLSPFLFYTTSIFSEVPAALLLIFSLYATNFMDKKWARCGIIGSAILLPWLKIRFGPISFALILLFIIKMRKRWRNLIIGVFVIIASGIIFLILDALLFKKLIFLSKYIHKETLWTLTSFNFKNFVSLTGLFLDQEFGLFAFSPILFFSVIGIFLLYQRSKWNFFASMAIIISYLFFLLQLRGYFWYGGLNPPARFIIVFIPIFALFWSIFYDRFRNNLSFVLQAFGLLSLIISLFHTIFPDLRLHFALGKSNFFKAISDRLNWDLHYILPSIIRPFRHQFKILVMIGVFSCITSLFLKTIFKIFRLRSNFTGFQCFLSLVFIILSIIGYCQIIKFYPQLKVEVEDLAKTCLSKANFFPSDLMFRLRQSKSPEEVMSGVIGYRYKTHYSPWRNLSDVEIKRLNLIDVHKNFGDKMRRFSWEVEQEIAGLSPTGIKLHPGGFICLFVPENGKKIFLRAKKEWNHWNKKEMGILKIKQEEKEKILEIHSRFWSIFKIDDINPKLKRMIISNQGKTVVDIDWIDFEDGCRAVDYDPEKEIPAINLEKDGIIHIDGWDLMVIDAFCIPFPGGWAIVSSGKMGCEIKVKGGRYSLQLIAMAGTKETKAKIYIGHQQVAEWLITPEVWGIYQESIEIEPGEYSLEIELVLPGKKIYSLGLLGIDEINLIANGS